MKSNLYQSNFLQQFSQNSISSRQNSGNYDYLLRQLRQSRTSYLYNPRGKLVQFCSPTGFLNWFLQQVAPTGLSRAIISYNHVQLSRTISCSYLEHISRAVISNNYLYNPPISPARGSSTSCYQWKSWFVDVFINLDAWYIITGYNEIIWQLNRDSNTEIAI